MSEPAPLFYDRLGGEAGLRKLVESFYLHMDTMPEARGVREMHPADLTGSAEKLFMFLSGWSGGPPLFVEKHGHPRLRARHMPFVIRKSERDQWMLCMVAAVDSVGLPEPTRSEFLHAMLHTADFMRNHAEEGEDGGKA